VDPRRASLSAVDRVRGDRHVNKHSDYEAPQLVLFGLASIVFLVFAWTVVAY
jgi:hypothetical protein